MMTTLNDLHHDPVSGLTYRIRPGQAGPGGAPAPCLLMLHGVGGNDANFIDLAPHLDPAVTLVLVRGPLALGPQQYAWFQVSFTANGPTINPAQAEQSRLALQQLVAQLPQRHAIDATRIAIAGFSQGGTMSASVGLTAPGQVAGFAILSGRILPEVLPAVQQGPALARLRAFVGHGVHDQKLGLHFAHQSRQVLGELGVPLDYHEYPAGHAFDAAMLADLKAWLGAVLAATA